MIKTNAELKVPLIRIKSVIDSCDTEEQLVVARRYAELAGADPEWSNFQIVWRRLKISMRMSVLTFMKSR